jgi:hypothetical protein
MKAGAFTPPLPEGTKTKHSYCGVIPDDIFALLNPANPNALMFLVAPVNQDGSYNFAKVHSVPMFVGIDHMSETLAAACKAVFPDEALHAKVFYGKFEAEGYCLFYPIFLCDQTGAITVHGGATLKVNAGDRVTGNRIYALTGAAWDARVTKGTGVATRIVVPMRRDGSAIILKLAAFRVQFAAPLSHAGHPGHLAHAAKQAVLCDLSKACETHVSAGENPID